jgi:hypothetical protein
MTSMMKMMIAVSLAAVAMSFGLFVLERAEAKAVPAETHPDRWPAQSSIALGLKRETVVAFIHPHCQCAVSALNDLKKTMAAHPMALAYVMFVRPDSMEEGWEVDEHWRSAAAMSAVVLPDPGGAEAARFGANTGDVVVYDESGALEHVVPSGAVAER